MHYLSPLSEGKHYFVPIVIKNKDMLLGIIAGIQASHELTSHIFKSLDFPIEEIVELNSYDSDNMMIASDRFNDILPDGRIESEMTKSERDAYLKDIIESAYDKMMCEDNNVALDCALKTSCECGLGHYTWKTIKDIPSESFSCVECGRVLIDYTNHDEWEYNYVELNNITKDQK